MPVVKPRGLIHAGFAARDITPEAATPNYAGKLLQVPPPDQPRLECLAAVLATDDAAIGLLTVDTTAIARTVVLSIRKLAAAHAATRDLDCVLVAATHTHCAPSLAPMFLAGSQPDPLWVDHVASTAVEALGQALAALKPAKLRTGIASAPGREFNRRLIRPDGRLVTSLAGPADPASRCVGPVDHDVPFWMLADKHAQPMGMIGSYACHFNAARSAFMSPDIPGFTRRSLQRRFGQGFTPILLPGAAGDVTWMDPFSADQAGGVHVAAAQGESLANQLSAAVECAPVSADTTLRWASRLLHVADRSLADSDFSDDGSRGTTPTARQAHEKRYVPERAAVERAGPTWSAAEITAVALGDTALVTNPGELFAQLGLDIRAQSPFRITMIGELTNGYVGYVPTEEAFDLGGYETRRTVYSSRLVKQAGRQFVDHTLALLNELAKP